MNNRSKMLYIFFSVLLLCTLICGLYFFDTGRKGIKKNLPPNTAILSDSENSIILTDKNGEIFSEVSVSGLNLSDDELSSLRKGLTASSYNELISIAEDFSD